VKKFCGYHWSFQNAGQTITYAVLADTSIDCNGACGSAADYFDNATMVASHEIVEAVTDPLGGVNDYPLGWYDSTGNGAEIGDLCNLQPALIPTGFGSGQRSGFTVQKEFDNASGNCILDKCVPSTCAGLGCGYAEDGCGNQIFCGTCPSGESCNSANQCESSASSSGSSSGGVVSCGTPQQCCVKSGGRWTNLGCSGRKCPPGTYACGTDCC
jgi:hypothetical protein